MQLPGKITTVLAVAAIGATPLAATSAAVAHGKGRATGHSKTHSAKKYGKYCQVESKKHVKGEKGTPFSQCVTAMAHLANGSSTSAQKACASAGLSKKHVKGTKGTPYSECVTGGKQLLSHQK